MTSIYFTVLPHPAMVGLRSGWMPHDGLPIRFDPAFEIILPEEDETQQRLADAMLSIARKTHDDLGHAHRAVHAKAHGYCSHTVTRPRAVINDHLRTIGR